MTRRPSRLALALALALTARPGFAQNPPGQPADAAQAEGEGRPLDGYLATAALAGLALFIVGKSARRS